MAATVPSETDSPIGGILMVISSLVGSVDRKPRRYVIDGEAAKLRAIGCRRLLQLFVLHPLLLHCRWLQKGRWEETSRGGAGSADGLRDAA